MNIFEKERKSIRRKVKMLTSIAIGAIVSLIYTVTYGALVQIALSLQTEPTNIVYQKALWIISFPPLVWILSITTGVAVALRYYEEQEKEEKQ